MHRKRLIKSLRQRRPNSGCSLNKEKLSQGRSKTYYYRKRCSDKSSNNWRIYRELHVNSSKRSKLRRHLRKRDKPTKVNQILSKLRPKN